MIFNFINFLFLIPMVLVGLICFYTDVKYGKIFNKWILLIFFYILFLYLFLFLYFLIDERGNIYYIFKLIRNGLIAIFVGYLLWYFKLWSAGDAKLFSVYSFLIPLNFYSKSYIPYFPSFNLLINLFIPLLFVLIGSAIFTTINEVYKLRNKIKKFDLPERRTVIKLLVTIFQMYLSCVFVFLLLQLFVFLTKIYSLGQILSNQIFLFFLLFLTINRFNAIKKEKRWLNVIFYGVIIGCTTFLFFLRQPYLLEDVFRTSLVFMVLIGFMRQILNYYIQKKEIHRVKIKDIKTGMMLVKNELVTMFDKLKNKADADKNRLKKIDEGALKNNQVEIIKEMFKENQEIEVGIYKTLPFAPFLFLSAMISIFTQNSFVSLINKIFEYLI